MTKEPRRRVRLRTERLAQELRRTRRSQNAWAQVLGLSKGYLSQLVNGHRRYPSAAVRERLLEALGLPFDALFVVEPFRSTHERGRRPERARLPRGESMSNLVQDTRFALRQFARRPAFYGFAALILALGIGTNATLFSAVKGVLLQPLPLPEPDRLVRLFEQNEGKGWGHSMVAPGNWRDWRESGSFTDIAVFLERNANLVGGDEASRVRFTACSPNFFSVVGVAPALGRGFTEEEAQPGRDDVVVLSHAFWTARLGGREDVLGLSVTLDGRETKVVGVMPEGFTYPQAGMDLWKPLGLAPMEAAERGGHWLKALGRLAEGTTLDAASSEMRAIAARLAQEHPETNDGWDVALTPLHQVETYEARTPLLFLWASTGFVLLIACVNVAHMLLVRSRARRGELALRRTLGADRRRLVRQLLTESLLLAAVAATAGIALAAAGLRLLPALAAGSLPRSETLVLDAWAVLFTVALATLCGVAFGTLPALRAHRTALASDLAAQRSGGSSRSWRRAMIAAEVAVAITVLVGAGLFARSLWQVLQVEPGFESQDLLSLRVEPPRDFQIDESLPLRELFASLQADRGRAAVFFGGLLDRLEAVPGVVSATAVNWGPLSGSHWHFELEPLDRPTSPGDVPPAAQSRVVARDYFRTVGIPLIAGRALEARDFQQPTGAAVVDEALARLLWPDEDPLGRRFRYLGPPAEIADLMVFTVVGVVGEVRQSSLEGAQAPTAYFPMPQAVDGHSDDWGMTLLLRTRGDGLALMPQVRAAVKEVDPTLPIFAVRTFEEVLDASVAGRRFQTLLLSGFAFLALLLAALGIYAVVAYSVSQRRREIGVRLALGAGRLRVLGQVLAEGMGPVALGLAAGALGTAGLARLLEGLLYGVEPVDPTVYLTGAAVLGFAALLACTIPAWQATRVDPTSALRAD